MFPRSHLHLPGDGAGATFKAFRANAFFASAQPSELLKGSTAQGRPLIQASVVIWLTNVGIFALAFWELDRGGPDDRVAAALDKSASFLFPQMTLGGPMAEAWRPSFVDYLYVSFTNATAFSPTDTMPLGPWPKVLMLVQSLASLVTVGLVAARAVNILK